MKRLSKLVAHEVSMVQRPANKKRFLVFKNADGEPVAQQPSLVSDLALTPEQSARLDAFLARRGEPVAKADGDAEGADPLDERAQASLKAVFRILKPMVGQIQRGDMDELLDELGIDDEDDDEDEDEDADADEGVDPADGAEEALDKSAETPQPGGPNMAKDSDEACSKAAGGKMKWDGEMPPGMDKDKHDGAMKAAQAAYKAHVAKDMDDDDDEVDKAAADWKDKDVAKGEGGGSSFAAIQKKHAEENRAVIAKCATLEQQVREMQEERVLKSIGDDLRGRLRNLPIDVAKTARVLKHLKEHDQAAHDDYLATLTAANQVSKSNTAFGGAGIYGAMGSSGVGANGELAAGDARGRMEAFVKDWQTKHVATAGDRPMTEPRAWAEAILDDRGAKLYNDMIAEEGRG